MKRAVIFVLSVVVITASGCSFYDAMFSVFGDHYSGGGETRQEKKWHYQQTQEDWGVR